MTAAAARYEMLGLLGAGGHAGVYRAYDRVLGREVAIKALLPHLAMDLDLRARFEAEAATLMRLRHANIVRVYDAACAETPPYFAMELLNGRTIAELILPGRGMPLAEALRLLLPLCSALDYLHSAGYVHRDVKASNVMVETNGRVVLMDLGIARAIDSAGRTRVGSTLGTPENMSPEQVRGEPVGPAADVYALGVLAYQLFAGRPPFVGDTAAVLHDHVFTPPPSLRWTRPDLPERVHAALDVALAKRPAQRFASAGAFLAALACQGEPRRSDDRQRGNPFGDVPPMALVVLLCCLLAIVLSIAAGFS